MQRDFTVTAKGIKRKSKKAFVNFENDESEKLTVFLDGPEQLNEFEIGQEFTIKIGEGEQRKLA